MELEQRVEALELSDRRKGLLTLALVLNAALILAVVVSLAKPAEQPVALSAADVEAERVVIVDDAGRARIVLGTISGVVGVFHVDEYDNPRLISGVNSEGKAAIRVYDPDGRLRYECATSDSGDVESLFFKLNELGQSVPTYKLP